MNLVDLAVKWEQSTPAQRQALINRVAPTSKTARFATPGELAQALDPSIVQTPALALIDKQLIGVRDAVSVMYQRRALFAQLQRSGVDGKIASEQVVDEIPQTGLTRVIITIGPQEGKSSRVSRHGVEWLLQQFPMLRTAIVSYDSDNATQFSDQIRSDIISFNGANDTIDLGLRLRVDDRAKSRFQLITGGGVRSVSIGGGLTGFPVDALLLDDPLKDQRSADSVIIKSSHRSWWQTVGARRLAPWAPVVLILTRWAEDDLAGYFIEKQRQDEAEGLANYDKWTVLNIPAQADHDPNKGETDPLGREPGEFMLSARGRSTDDWLLTKGSMSERYWNALYQGRPSPESGGTFHSAWFRYYDSALWQQEIDGTFKVPGYELWQSWDFTFRDTSGTDFVVGQLWATKGPNAYLVTQTRARLSFTNSLDAMRRMTRLFPQSRGKYVEGKANGDAIVDVLKKELTGIIVVNPTKSKELRADAVSPFVRAGNVWLPSSDVALAHPEIAFSVPEFVAEFTSFPNGAHDDQVDAATQFLRERFLKGGDGSFSSPRGRIATGTMSASQPSRLSPVQARLAAQARSKINGK